MKDDVVLPSLRDSIPLNFILALIHGWRYFLHLICNSIRGLVKSYYLYNHRDGKEWS